MNKKQQYRMFQRNFFDQPIKNDIKTYEKIRVKETITQLVVC